MKFSTRVWIESAQSLAMGGGPRFVVVREAHALKDLDALEPLLGPPVAREELYSICVFVSKDLDKRKKFSKRLLEKAACVPCEEVPEQEKPAPPAPPRQQPKKQSRSQRKKKGPRPQGAGGPDAGNGKPDPDDPEAPEPGSGDPTDKLAGPTGKVASTRPSNEIAFATIEGASLPGTHTPS